MLDIHRPVSAPTAAGNGKYETVIPSFFIPVVVLVDGRLDVTHLFEVVLQFLDGLFEVLGNLFRRLATRLDGVGLLITSAGPTSDLRAHSYLVRRLADRPVGVGDVLGMPDR